MSSDTSHTLHLLGELVKINSVNPTIEKGGAGEKEIAEYVATYFDDLGLETTLQEVEPGRFNAVGTLKGGGEGKTLLLEGHMDTVGIDYMTIDPLTPVVKEGRMYGRGTVDMKGGLAAMMSALRRIVDSGTELGGDLVFAGVCDEEYTQIGCRKAMETIRADSAVIGEPTDLRIQVAHRGVVGVEVETEGVTAHSARWNIGVDAITKMGKFLAAYETINKMLLEKKHPLVGCASVHASLIEGGNTISSYPSRCKTTVLRWIVPPETLKDVEDEVSSIFQGISSDDDQFKASYNVIYYGPPAEVSRDELICRLLGDSVKEESGVEPKYFGASVYYEQGIISAHGVPTVCFGPSGGGAHSEEEWVDLDSVYKASRVYESVIKNYCGVDH